MRTFLAVFGVLICLLSRSAFAAESVITRAWQTLAGDRVVVDLQKSLVYLVHADGGWIELDGLTGQKRVVAYDGIVYNAATPERTWTVSELEKKGKSATFGEGRFFRLAWPGHQDKRTGNDSTAYGIHSHRSFDAMLKDKHERNVRDPQGTGHRSMGCILLSEDDLTLVEQTWEANGDSLQVITQAVVDRSTFSIPALFGITPVWLKKNNVTGAENFSASEPKTKAENSLAVAQ